MPHRNGLLNEEMVNACLEKRQNKETREVPHYGRKATKTETTVDDENVNVEVSIADDNDTNAMSGGKRKSAPRDRKFSLVSYIPPERIKSFLERSEWVQHWAMCTHNRDVLVDGSMKETHTHIVLYTYNAHTSSAIRKIFNRYAASLVQNDEEPQNTLAQVASDMVSSYRYLVHSDDPKKVQYEAHERIVDLQSYWSALEQSSGYNDVLANSGKKMLDDLLSGTSSYEMVRRYGKEYIYHAKQYREMVETVFTEQLRSDITTDRFKDFCAFILDASAIKDKEIATFFKVLEYVQDKLRTDRAVFEYEHQKKVLARGGLSVNLEAMK